VVSITATTVQWTISEKQYETNTPRTHSEKHNTDSTNLEPTLLAK
jgi:hypothetical protein